MCYGYSLEVPQPGTSNEYLQHTFSGRNEKDISIFSDEKSALSVAMSFLSPKEILPTTQNKNLAIF